MTLQDFCRSRLNSEVGVGVGVGVDDAAALKTPRP
jgi:hypothetical protein